MPINRNTTVRPKMLLLSAAIPVQLRIQFPVREFRPVPASVVN